jgi:hypothetical protein
MADPVFLPPIHFAEGDVVAVGLKYRVVTVALVSTHRPDDAALHGPGKNLVMPIRPGQDEGAAEPCGPGLRRVALQEGVVGAGHRHPEIPTLRCFGPIGGVDPRRPAQRVDLDAAIVGQRGQAVALAAAWALMRAFSTKVVPVSSGSGKPCSRADVTSIPNGSSSAAISSSLPWL